LFVFNVFIPYICKNLIQIIMSEYNGYYKELTPQRRMRVEILVREAAETIGTLGKEAIELFNNEFLCLATKHGEAYYGIDSSQDAQEEV
jgi:hypothetical protein